MVSCVFSEGPCRVHALVSRKAERVALAPGACTATTAGEQAALRAATNQPEHLDLKGARDEPAFCSGTAARPTLRPLAAVGS